ncbi:MAG: energy transducer TonB [Acidobacteriota bacterium]
MKVPSHIRRFSLVIVVVALFSFPNILLADDTIKPERCVEGNYGEVSATELSGRKPLKIFEMPKADGTPAATKARIYGKVVLKVRFLAGGRIGTIEVIEGLPGGLTPEAIRAAKMIRFLPARQDGQMINVAETVEYNFADPERCQTARNLIKKPAAPARLQ